MMFAQYARLETRAGGVSCTDREFIRACRRVLTDKGRSRATRDARQEWIRDGLRYLNQSRRLLGGSQ